MKILCKYHEDTEPSMHVYQNDKTLRGYCFVCSAMAVIEPGDIDNLSEIKPSRKITDIAGMMSYIQHLPTKIIRGIELPFDQVGYYLRWPTNDHYKRRNWNEGKNRYTGPTGKSQPLFIYPNMSKHLVLVEGELNAVSLRMAVGDKYCIASPGPANNFMRFIKQYMVYKQITLVLDYDAPGIVFGCQIKDHLLRAGKRVNLILVEEDYNDLLQKKGQGHVKQQFEKELE